MTRNLSESIKQAANSDVVRPIVFMEIRYDTGSARLHTGLGDRQWNGHTWAGVGTLVSIETIAENSELYSSGIQATLTAHDAPIAIALSEDYLGRPIYIHLGLLNEEDALIDEPIMMFSGLLDKQSISIGEGGAVTIVAENRLIDWQRPREFRLNNETLQVLQPGDKGAEFVEQAAEKAIYWGVKDK